MTIKKEAVEKIQENFKGNLEAMENALFYIEMGDRIDDWGYYRALSYCIAKAKGQDISKYVLI